MTPRDTEETKAVHFLSRTSFGATPAEVERVRALGLERYLEEQLHPEQLPDAAVEKKLAGLETLKLDSRQLFELFPPRQQRQRAERQAPMGMQAAPGPRHAIVELQQAKVLRAVYSRKQLYEVMVDFWLNHFNVFAAKGADRWLMTSYDRDTIRPRALGRFRDLLLATAQSPAMLFYLDNWLSVSPNGRAPGGGARRGLNENYARELLELHTLGVDGGYTQKDVEEVARCFTGWTLLRPRRGAEFRFAPGLHDPGEKRVLGLRIPPGGGMDDGIKVIDLLAHHPATARFIATKLVRRFVADEPPPSLVERAAREFSRSGGDIRKVLRAIFTSREFFSADVAHAKVKKPLEFVSSALRLVDADTEAGMRLLRRVAEMAEPLYLSQPPTGYPDVGAAWIHPNSLLARINFAFDLAGDRIPGTQVRWETLNGAHERIVELMSPRGLSPATREALVQTRGSQRWALLLASPEFQRR